MKTKIFMLAFCLLLQTLFSQDIVGSWYGNLDIQGQKLPLVLHVEKTGTDLKSSLDSPMQGAKGIPVDKTTFENNELIFAATGLGLSFQGKLIGDKLEGIFKQGGMSLPLSLSRDEEIVPVNRPQEPKPPFSYDSKEISFKNETQFNVLAGTLVTSRDFKKNQPVLVMITGSGAQNRDEEMFRHKPFLVIADHLAHNGIATLRLDDRGIGASEPGNNKSTTADFATDINSAVNYLVKNGYKNIGLIGHSEGGMIAPMVSTANKNVKFLVLLAGPGVPILELTLDQNRKIAEDVKLPRDMIEEVLAIKEETFTYAKNYDGKEFKTDFTKYLESNYPDMNAQEQAAYIEQMTSSWFQYFIKFEPDTYLSKVKIPVLAVNGSLDLQVSAKENLAGIKQSLTKAGNKNYEVVEYEGLNHLFQTAVTGNPSEYGQIEETFSPKVLDKMTSWILKLN